MESKLRKAENSIRAYREHIEKMSSQHRNEQFRELSMQYSFLLDDLNREEPRGRNAQRDRSQMMASGRDDLAASKVSRVVVPERTSR